MLGAQACGSPEDESSRVPTCAPSPERFRDHFDIEELRRDCSRYMIGKMRRAVSRLTRSLASFPLKLLSANSRAQLLETLSEKMIVTTPIPGGQICFYAPSPLLRFRAASVLSKETDTIQWINGFEQQATFWDIGANVGVYSLYAAVCKQAKALAFEPSAANFFVLARNIQLNQLADRVAAYCVAFSDRTRLGVLNLSTVQAGGALSRFGEAGERSQYAGNIDGAVHGMLGMTIDDFASEFAPPLPNYLKIDVDGLEMLILKGARTTLSDPRLRSLMVELSVTNESENE
jgi:FkbM family methyltransferase